MAIRTGSTDRRLNYIESAGKLDMNPTSSPRAHFQTLVPQYDSARSNYKASRISYKQAKVRLEEYENKSLAEKARHPLKNRRLHNQLKNQVKTQKLAMEKAKLQYKVKKEEMKNFQRKVREQYRSVKDYEKTKKMYAEITEPANSKFVSIFPAQRASMDAWIKNYENIYNGAQFSMNPANPHSNIPSPSGPEFQSIEKAYSDCKKSKAKDALQKTADKAKSIIKPKDKEQDENDR